MPKDPSTMSDDELREEHRKLNDDLQGQHEERKEYEPAAESGSRQTREGANDVTGAIDEQMENTRRRQRELYEEYQRRH